MNDRFQRVVWAVFAVVLLTIGSAAFFIESHRVTLPVVGPLRPFSLTNQAGASVSLASIQGAAGVVNVIFTACPTQCPKLTAQMARIQSRMPPGTRLLSLTADPRNDTPEVLSRYGVPYHADTNRWWFLTGTKAEIYRFAVEDLKFNLLEAADPATARLEDRFIHSSDFALFDRAVRLRAVVHGEDPDAVDQVVRLLKKLQREAMP